MNVKKEYVTPSVSGYEMVLDSMIASSPTTDYNTGKVTVGPGDDEAGGDDEFDARQRGGDFGTLW